MPLHKRETVREGLLDSLYADQDMRASLPSKLCPSDEMQPAEDQVDVISYPGGSFHNRFNPRVGASDEQDEPDAETHGDEADHRRQQTGMAPIASLQSALQRRSDHCQQHAEKNRNPDGRDRPHEEHGGDGEPEFA